jgi:hypothetical protein
LSLHSGGEARCFITHCCSNLISVFWILTTLSRFNYTTTGFSDIQTAPAELASTPASLIFNIELQRVKIFNFIEKELQISDAFDEPRIFEVRKRTGDEPALSLSELFDFSLVSWDGNKGKDYGRGLIVYRTLEIDDSGEWFGSEYGGLLGAGRSGFNSILDYASFIDDTTHQSPTIGIQDGFYYVSTTTSVGYRYQIFSSEALNSWNKISPLISSNITDGGNFVGGDDILIESGAIDTFLTKKFYSTVVSPIEYTD